MREQLHYNYKILIFYFLATSIVMKRTADNVFDALVRFIIAIARSWSKTCTAALMSGAKA